MKINVSIITLLLISTFSSAQQIGNGYAAGLTTNDFNQPLASGIYEINSLNVTPDESHSWQHLFVMRHSNQSNNFQFQLASSFNENDRVFFRKIANSNNVSWIELATRNTNIFNGNQMINGRIGINTPNPETLLNVNLGSGGSNGTAGIRVGGLNNYPSLEFGVDGDYHGMIRSYGNNINYYAGHWITKGNTATEDHSHNWYTSKNGSSDWSTVKMILNENGNLGIGTLNPKNKLDVKGTIHSQEVKVDMDKWSDFVFKKDYNLPTLEQVEKHITEKGHLENIPSEEEVLKNGINLGEMNARLLQKIEELTLYVIEQDKKNNKHLQEIKNLKNQIDTLNKQNKDLNSILERLSQLEQKLN